MCVVGCMLGEHLLLVLVSLRVGCVTATATTSTGATDRVSTSAIIASTSTCAVARPTLPQ